MASFRSGLGAGHPVIDHRDIVKRACNLASGDLYIYPNSSTTIDATQPVTFQWNTACSISTSTIDLYLYEPSSSTGLIHAWTGVPFSSGSYTTTLSPKWWNSTSSATLQLSIIDGGGMAWMTSSPAGPPFAITYSASNVPASTATGTAPIASQSADAIFQNVSTTSSSGISKGAIAAAVVVPLIFLAIIAAVAIRFYRIREADKRKRWSAAISTHSGMDWRDGALSHEKPASIYSRQGRPSDVNSTNRTSSMFAGEHNLAGAGARPYYGRSQSETDVNNNGAPEMISRGPVFVTGERQSRISFAETTRPDRRSRLSLGESLHTRPSSFFGIGKHATGSHSATDIVTPSKKQMAYATGSAVEDEDEMNISPSQLQGPGAFADAEMRRVGNGRRTGRRSILSLGKDNRRDSTASALSTEDFKSAASARGSVDELRDLESIMLHRRSMMSQTSVNSPSSPYIAPMEDAMESLSQDAALAAKYTTNTHKINGTPTSISSPLPAVPMPTVPGPAAGATNIQTQDRMLSVYSTRAKTNQVGAPALGAPLKSSIKYNSNSASGTNNNNTMPPPAVPVTSGAAPLNMKSLVHLNNGTVSPAALGIKTIPVVPVVDVNYIDVGTSETQAQGQNSTSAPASGSRLALGLRIPSFTKRSGSSNSVPQVDKVQAQVQDRGSMASNAASDGSRYSVGEDK